MDETEGAQRLGSKGGRARARLLKPERRSEIASTAAKARWRQRGQGVEARLASNKNRSHLHVGASRIREVIVGLAEAERAAFIRTIWPDLPERISRLMARYPGELRVTGRHLKLPESWMDDEFGGTNSQIGGHWHPGDE